MRKLAFVIIMLLSVAALSAQNIVLKAYQGEYTEERDWSEAIQVKPEYMTGVYIIMDVEDELVRITNGWDDVFKMDQVIRSTDTVDNRVYENMWIVATDQDDTECIILTSALADGALFGDVYGFRVRIFYETLWYGYYCKKQ